MGGGDGSKWATKERRGGHRRRNYNLARSLEASELNNRLLLADRVQVLKKTPRPPDYKALCRWPVNGEGTGYSGHAASRPKPSKIGQNSK